MEVFETVKGRIHIECDKNVNEDNEGGNDDVDDLIFLLPFPGDSSSSPFTACRLHS